MTQVLLHPSEGIPDYLDITNYGIIVGKMQLLFCVTGALASI